jgi:hypothetical protein
MGAADFTSDVVGKVLCALRKVIDRDLRTTGSSLIDGLAKIVLVHVKARSAQYVKLNGRTVLVKAKGPHRRVYGRVQWEVGVWRPLCVFVKLHFGCCLFGKIRFLDPLQNQVGVQMATKIRPLAQKL